jgi:hypothetical protein
MELHLLRSQFRNVPNLDELVLDSLSGYANPPEPQTTERSNSAQPRPWLARASSARR